MNFAHSEVATLDPNTMRTLCEEYVANNYIDPETSERLGVKRGLRNPDGTGVLAGLTNVCDVVGYKKDQEGHVIPTPGKLIYRGVNINEIVDEAYRNDRFVFEEVIWLLLFGSLPNREQLDDFCEILAEHRALPEGFMDTMNAPSPNIMNKLQRCVLGLYSYDEHAEDLSLENILSQSINLIASMPTMMVNAYQMKRRYYDKQSMFFHLPKPGQSTAEHILSTYRPDQKFTHEEAKLLDMCLLVHADHGGGNCSTFTTRVLSSSGTDTYSAIAAAIGALKGPKHGGANLMVNRQLKDILKHVENPEDDDEVREYLRRILRKQAGDGSGLIYGMGHAVYTISDPREVILKQRARHLAYDKGFEEEYNMLCSIERLAPGIFAEEKGSTKPVCANVDLFSGLIYNMLGISEDIYTPLFAIARVPGWCAHRVEEVVFANRIIRPAYKYLGVRQKALAVLIQTAHRVQAGGDIAHQLHHGLAAQLVAGGGHIAARQTLPLAPMPSPVCAWSARCGGAIWHWVSWCWLQCLWAVHSLPARKRCVAAGRWPVFWLLSVQYVFWPQRVHRSRWAQLPVWAALCGAFWNACAPRGSAP